MNISDEAVEAAAKVIFQRHGAKYYCGVGDWEDLDDRFSTSWIEDARLALTDAAPHLMAQALEDAVEAFPLETITAPDTAVAWLMNRAAELR